MSKSGERLLRKQYELSRQAEPAKPPMDFTRKLLQIKDGRTGRHRPDRIRAIYQETINLLDSIKENKIYMSDGGKKKQLKQIISDICNDMIRHRYQAIKGYGSYFGSQMRDKGEELLRKDLAKIKILHSCLDEIATKRK